LPHPWHSTFAGFPSTSATIVCHFIKRQLVHHESSSPPTFSSSAIATS